MNLSGLLRPQSGAVLWQGKPLDYSKRGLLALRQQVATVFQDPDQQIFYTDIDSDIAFSLRNLGVAEEEIARRVDDALTLVDAQGFRHQPIQCLSHGQKKRVAIAGALVLQARYLRVTPRRSAGARRTRRGVCPQRTDGPGRAYPAVAGEAARAARAAAV